MTLQNIEIEDYILLHWLAAASCCQFKIFDEYHPSSHIGNLLVQKRGFSHDYV